MTLDMKGLILAPGQLSSPNGAMTIANNIEIPAMGLVRKRRGFTRVANGFGGPAHSIYSTKQLCDAGYDFLTVMAGGASMTKGNALRIGNGVSGLTTLLTPPDSASLLTPLYRRTKVAVSLKNHYISSAIGNLRLDSTMGLAYAGMPKAPGFDTARASGVLTGTASWLADGSYVAYRCLWGTKDQDNVEMRGSPSGRWVVGNVAGTTGYAAATVRSVIVRLRLPYHVNTASTALTTGYFYELYRSIQTTGTPNDEMQLVYRGQLTAADITNGYVEITDSTPEAAMGAYLYTNTQSGGDISTGVVMAPSVANGVLAANDPPPVAGDVALWNNVMWYADIAFPQRLTFSILAVGAAGTVLKATDVITLTSTGTRTYTAVAGAPASASQFTVVTSGTVSANIRQTAINLCEAINADSGNTYVWAYYIGNDASPGSIGKIMLESRRLSDSYASYVTFSLQVTTGSGIPYSPQLGSAQASQADSWRNGICFSKPFQADAVPPANYLRVSRNDSRILRIVPLRDYLYLFTDDGVFWVRGTTAQDFSIEPFDTTFRLAARESCVALEDAIYAWGIEGIARITPGGLDYIDLPIRNYVQNIFATRTLAQGGAALDNNTSFSASAFAVAYRRNRRVLFFYPDDNSTASGAFKPNCTNALVWNVETSAWTTMDNITTDASSNLVACPKSFGAVRYSDELLCQVEWNSTGNDTKLYLENNTLTVSDYQEDGYDKLGSPTTARPFTSTVEWTTVSPDPHALTHWQEIAVFLSPSDVFSAYQLPASIGVYFEADREAARGSTVSSIPVVLEHVRLIVPQASAISARLGVGVTHSVAADYFSLNGMSLKYNSMDGGPVK